MLQLVWNFDSVRSLKCALASAHRLVKKVNMSVKATEKVIALLGRKLVDDCPTRWFFLNTVTSVCQG